MSELARAAGVPAATPEKEAARILIIDDSTTNLRLLGQHLKSSGYRVAVARDGEQALAAVDKAAPDLILLDVIMPVMDGFETCAELKKREETRDIPVIFLTARTDHESVVHGFELGGADYVSKPFNRAELLARVRTHLELRRAISELRSALAQVKTLTGLLPMCANCKGVRDKEDNWHRLERYLMDNSDARLSHGICPPCAKKIYPDRYRDFYPELDETEFGEY